jgi:hypothetical protein
LAVSAYQGDLLGYDERSIVVNELGSAPPLVLDGISSPEESRPGNSITVTASVMDETLRPLTDTLTAVTATVYTTPTVAYSGTVPLTLDEDGFFRHPLSLPADAPIGTYWVDFAATHPGYEPAHGETSFFVNPLLTMTLEVPSESISYTQMLTISAQLYDRGEAITDGGGYAEVGTPGGVVALALQSQGGSYTASFRPRDLGSNLGAKPRGGEWEVQATLDFCGSEATASGTVDVCDWADLDCNWHVDVSDIQTVAGRWRCEYGEECYGLAYDVDGDGTITVIDIMQVAAEWGWSRPTPEHACRRCEGDGHEDVDV